MSAERPWLDDPGYQKLVVDRPLLLRRIIPQDTYVLLGHDVVPVDFAEWAVYLEWASQPDPLRPGMTRRHVDDIVFGHEGIGEIRVSTVFLGLDHSLNFMGGNSPPVVFETMIFGGGGDLDGYQTRCSTWDEAVQMHADAVAQVKNAFTELAKVSGA